MFDIGGTDIGLPSIETGNGITIGTLLAACDAQPRAFLTFSCQSRPVKPGYHITDVRVGQFTTLDLQGNPEAWSEIFIQLWDVADGDPAPMQAEKFAAIVRKVCNHAELDPSAKLTFEVSDGIAPIQSYRAGFPEEVSGVLRVFLEPRAASGQPRDHWLEGLKQRCTCCDPASRDLACY